MYKAYRSLKTWNRQLKIRAHCLLLLQDYAGGEMLIDEIKSTGQEILYDEIKNFARTTENLHSIMKLLFINYEYPPIGAGAANATCQIGKNMVCFGHDVYVLTSCFKSLKGWSIEDGVKVFRCKTMRKKTSRSNIFEMFLFVASAFFVLPCLLKRKKIEAMIVFFSFPCGPLGLWGKLAANVPYVISLRGGDVPGNETSLNIIHKILKPLRQLVFKNSHAIIANSKGLKTLSEKSDLFPVKVIPNGVDTDFLAHVGFRGLDWIK